MAQPSSRLMNMKFMQRAAASDNSSPRTPAEPAAKKQRTSVGSYKSTPASTPRSKSEVVVDEQAAAEQKREEAFAREAAARGDSKWYLSFQEPQYPAVSSPLRIVSAGYGALDSSAAAKDQSSEDEEEEKGRPQLAGRRSFGKFNKAVEKQQKQEADSDSQSSSDASSTDDEDDESDDPTGVNALIAAERKQAGEKARTERKAKKIADKAEATKMADQRRKKEVNLNNVTSISGFGSGGTRKLPGLEDRECHKCGGKGHLKYQCPQTQEWKRKRGMA